jgi:hypothetical protein
MKVYFGTFLATFVVNFL